MRNCCHANTKCTPKSSGLLSDSPEPHLGLLTFDTKASHARETSSTSHELLTHLTQPSLQTPLPQGEGLSRAAFLPFHLRGPGDEGQSVQFHQCVT